MMGPVSKRDLWIVGILAFLAINLTVAWHFYERGKYSVALKSTQDSLAVVVKQGNAIKEQRDAVASVLAEEIKRSDSSRVVYIHDKTKVALRGDTAVTKDSSQVLLPEVATKLRDDDTHIANLEAENGTLRFALHTDTLAINNLERQVELNQKIAKMVQGPSHFSHGIQIGVGETLSSDGVKRASIYVGYGVQIRTP